MAKELKQVYGLSERSFHIDIAGNDCALLKEFRDEIGHHVLNVDPAKNLAPICCETLIPTIEKFWSEKVSEDILFQYGYADLITATNVFAHVDDVYDFMRGVKRILNPTGVLILEFPYLKDFIDNREFDTVYFEHLSYFSIKPLVKLCNTVGLNVMRVEKQDIHGGSVRVHIGYGEHDDTVRQFVLKEEGLTMDAYKQFAADAYYEINNFRENITALKQTGKRICAFAASAKGNTLLNCAGVNFKLISMIFDETPEKQGKFYPGTMIEIWPIKEMKYYHHDYMVILSWNFAESIMNKCRAKGFDGKFIIPIPKFTIVE
jgi:SAM-dependent methyltransferase